MSVSCTLNELLVRINAMPILEPNESPPVALQPSKPFKKASPVELIDRVRRGENWHTNLLQLVAHWVGCRWSDEEILLGSKEFTLSGYSVDQTRKEMSSMIAGARKKWEVSNPLHSTSTLTPLIVYDLGDFVKLEIPPREMVISPIIPTQGLAMLYAPRGIGKTYVALSIALAVATGSSLFGLRWHAPEPRPVLFLDGEMPSIVLQDRLKLLAANFGPVKEKFLRIITPDFQETGIPDLSTEEGQQMIEAHLEGVQLVILDNLSSLLRNGRENEAESWMPLQSWLLSLRRRGISVLIIHHAGKSGNQRGTSKREDLLDTVVLLKRPENYDPTYGAQFEVHYEKARGFFGEEAKAFDARLSGDKNSLGWEVKDLEKDSLVDQVKRLHSQGLTQRKIAAQVGTSVSTINRILKTVEPPPTPVQDEIEF